MIRSTLLAIVLAAVLGTVLTSAQPASAQACPAERTLAGLPDHRSTGNRVVGPCEPLHGTWSDVGLDEVPAWVVAHPGRPGHSWLLTGADGSVTETRQGRLAEAAQITAGEAPSATMHDGELKVRPRSEQDVVGDVIPGGRAVRAGHVGAVPVGPTQRYPHGVLGDDIEASALRIWTEDGTASRVELADDEVIEGISAIAAGLDDDGLLGLLVTVSDAEDGARLRAYSEQGEVIAESDPIGRGFRWLHQIGVGPTGPDGEIEIIAVRTPHIGGVVEAYRLDGDRLERVAAIEGYSSHVIGSANLDMALLADTDADGQLEIVVPNQAMTELAILERTEGGFIERDRLPLDGQLATNIAAAVGRDGRLSLAVGTADGRLRVFR